MPTSQEQRSFGKHQRLLTASEFKAVFDGACYKSSHRHILLLARPNELSNARLGTVVSKKNAKLAVQRNKLKRLLREQFRFHQVSLAGLDIVALVKPGLWQQENTAIIELINQQWARLLKQQDQAREKATAEQKKIAYEEKSEIALPRAVQAIP